MKKLGFLVPVAAVAALLSGRAGATAVQTTEPQKEDRSGTSCVPSISEQVIEAFYDKDGERHALLMKRSETGEILASHRSHRSHRSHSSHRSGY